MTDEFMDNPYEPDENELRELDEILKHEHNNKPKNRLAFVFHTQSHFEGWLRTHGIRW